MRVRANNTSGGGGSINPTVISAVTKDRVNGTLISYTIDLSKLYMLVLNFRYAGDSTYRTNAYYIDNGTLENLSGSWSAVGIYADLNGTTLAVKADSSGGKHDITLIQLD